MQMSDYVKQWTNIQDYLHKKFNLPIKFIRLTLINHSLLSFSSHIFILFYYNLRTYLKKTSADCYNVLLLYFSELLK